MRTTGIIFIISTKKISVDEYNIDQVENMDQVNIV
jgi:hypothetical protein